MLLANFALAKSVTNPSAVSAYRDWSSAAKDCTCAKPNLQIGIYHGKCGLKIAMTPLKTVRWLTRTALLCKDGKLYECAMAKIVLPKQTTWHKYSGGAYQTCKLAINGKCPWQLQIIHTNSKAKRKIYRLKAVLR